jgi:hypothetical protein
MTTDQRIENLEKGLASARRLNCWLLAAVGLALGVWILAGTFGPTMAAAPGGRGAAKEIRANRFVVEDENGKNRMVLFASKDGPGLGLFDDNGNNRVTLLVFGDGPKLVFKDEKGNQRAGLSVTKDGPALLMVDENGKFRAWLNATKDGPGLGLSDANGNLRATVGVTQATSPDGRITIYPESSLLLYGTDGKVIWQAR